MVSLMLDKTLSAQRDSLKAHANANIERLLDKWGIRYKFASDDELDFIANFRNDGDFGACRYNVKKGIGADFAATVSSNSFSRVGFGLDRSDFDLGATGGSGAYFDIIGLCKLVKGLATYTEAFNSLAYDLHELSKQSPLSPKLAIDQTNHSEFKLELAKTLLNNTVDYKGTLAEKYLNSRAIYLNKPAEIRFHARVFHKVSERFFPCLILPVRALPTSDLLGVHRIFISSSGDSKALVDNPKMLLGKLKGNAIWFGDPQCDTMYLAEGPENALTLYAQDNVNLMCCGISSGNLPAVSIPETVKKIVVCADRDIAGMKAASKAVNTFAKGHEVSVLLPPMKKLSNGKFADFNDIARGTE